MYRSGYRTSEFWLTISYLIISFLVLMGFVNAENQTNAANDLAHTMEFIGMVLSQGVVLAKYHHARQRVKIKHLEYLSDQSRKAPQSQNESSQGFTSYKQKYIARRYGRL